MNSIKNDGIGTVKSIYPCLKKSKHTGRIVLFMKPRFGVLIWQDTANSYAYNVGDVDTEWSEENFELYNGSVTLSN